MDQPDQRRGGMRDRLAGLAGQVAALPVRRDDLDVAVARLGAAQPGDAALLAALREAVIARLGGHAGPERALAATLEAVGQCALLVAEAFALAPRGARNPG